MTYITLEATIKYAEMYLAANGTAMPVTTDSEDIAIRHFTTGDLDGWTFDAGGTGPIASYATADGGASTAVNDVGHGLVTGDIISINDSTNYNGIHEVTKVTDDQFKISVAFAGDDGASNQVKPSTLTAGANAAGEYQIGYTLSCSKGAGTAATVLYKVFVNTTADAKLTIKRVVSGTDTGAMAGQGLVTIAAGDQIFLGFNTSNTDDLTFEYGTIFLNYIHE